MIISCYFSRLRTSSRRCLVVEERSERLEWADLLERRETELWLLARSRWSDLRE